MYHEYESLTGAFVNDETCVGNIVDATGVSALASWSDYKVEKP